MHVFLLLLFTVLMTSSGAGSWIWDEPATAAAPVSPAAGLRLHPPPPPLCLRPGCSRTGQHSTAWLGSARFGFPRLGSARPTDTMTYIQAAAGLLLRSLRFKPPWPQTRVSIRPLSTIDNPPPALPPSPRSIGIKYWSGISISLPFTQICSIFFQRPDFFLLSSPLLVLLLFSSDSPFSFAALPLLFLLLFLFLLSGWLISRYSISFPFKDQRRFSVSSLVAFNNSAHTENRRWSSLLCAASVKAKKWITLPVWPLSK